MRKASHNSLLNEKNKIKSMCILQKQRKKGLEKNISKKVLILFSGFLNFHNARTILSSEREKFEISTTGYIKMHTVNL